jgi:hypothetical protein
MMSTLVEFFFGSDSVNADYVTSTFDNSNYLVQNYPEKELAANMLALVRHNLFKLINHLITTNKTGANSEFAPFSKYINFMEERLKKNTLIMEEGIADGEFTSYSINKGEKIVFCLRTREKNKKLHNINTVMYVAIHELAHVACPEEHHTPLFFKINKFFLQESIKIGIYKYVNYSAQPEEYCGLHLNTNVLN